MLVSIVVNNHNYGRFLRAAVESALAQTYREVEVVVVDDGSTDDSREIIAAYGARVRPLLKENGGQASALNAGFALCRGEIVLFLDADDLLDSAAVARVVERWRAGVAKVHFPLRVIDGGGRETGALVPKYRLPRGDLRATVLGCGGYPSPPTSGNAFARGMLERVLPMAEDHLSPDGHLIQAAPFFGEVVALTEPLGCFRMHGSNNWAAAELEAGRLREYLRSDEQRADALREVCARLGVGIPPDFVLRNPDHLQGRLASLALDPDHHPYPGDRAGALAWKGAAVARRGRYPLSRKLLLTAWFLGVAATGGAVRRRLVRMAFVPAARPAFLRAVLP